MRPAARLAAAMEILDHWLAGDGPADRLIAAWGATHRFAGSKDRSAIADRVYAVLRRRSGAAALLGAETGRALVLGTLALEDGLAAEAIADALCGPHAPVSLTEAEQAALARGIPGDAPPWILGNYPAWLHPALAESLGEALPAEMEALSRRAPLDLRVNSLKSTISEAVTALLEDGLSASPCPWAPGGLRLPAGAPVTRSDTYLQGLVEIQDEGSQLASLLAGAAPGETVIDLAAGAGGKSLALAGQMANRGRLIAADVAAERLARLAPRALRAGATIIESRSLRAEPGPDEPDLPDLVACADLVLVDAPCSGSGTWRREPEAKWRLSPERLAELIRIQSGLLDRAARLVRPGGRLAYLTCSMLEAENSGVIHAFLERDLEHGANFGLISPYDVMNEAGLGAVPCHRRALGVSLSTGKTGTDGFFMTLLRKGP